MLRKQEQLISPEIAELVELVQSWVQIKKVQISKSQSIQLALGNEVAVHDNVYCVHPITGEIIVTGVDINWRKTISKHLSIELVS